MRHVTRLARAHTRARRRDAELTGMREEEPEGQAAGVSPGRLQSRSEQRRCCAWIQHIDAPPPPRPSPQAGSRRDFKRSARDFRLRCVYLHKNVTNAIQPRFARWPESNHKEKYVTAYSHLSITKNASELSVLLF